MSIRRTFLVTLCIFSQTATAVDIAPIDCMIEPNVIVELSSSVAGVLDTLTVDKSDEVKHGQVVATLNSDVQKVTVKTGKERVKLARAEHKRAVELYREKAITQSEKEQSDHDMRLSELELQQAKTNLNLRRIKSPIDGIVMNRYSTPGEFVETKPILKIAQLDPLRIEVVSPVANYGKIKKGMKAIIVPEFGQYEDLVAEVVVVDKVIDAASGTFGIRLEMDNKDHAVPGGLKCKARFLAFLAADVTTDNPTPPEMKPEMMPELVSVPVVPESFGLEQRGSENTMCMFVGPYVDFDQAKQMMDLIQSDVVIVETRTVSDSEKSYLVVSENKFSWEDALKLKEDMLASDVTDLALINSDKQFRIALGVYRVQSSAEKRTAALKSKGFSTVIEPHDIAAESVWVDIVYAAQAEDLIRQNIPEQLIKKCDKAMQASLNNSMKR